MWHWCIVGWSVVAVMQINQVILVDLYPGKGASVTANVSLDFLIHPTLLLRFMCEVFVYADVVLL